MRKVSVLRKSAGFALAALIVMTPVLAQAQQARFMQTQARSEIDLGRADGERDAQAAANKPLWFAAGCLGGLIGLVVAYAIEPNPPATKLLGKSPEYTAAYTDAYKGAAKSTQTRMALYGCGTAAVFYIVYFVVVIAAASSTTP